MAGSGTVTVLFTDLVRSTQLLGRAGDEAGQRIFRAHHKLMADAISSNGGEELQWLGDGVLAAAFSSTADAVSGAIRIQQTARRPIEGARANHRVPRRSCNHARKQHDKPPMGSGSWNLPGS
jgi:class 3 adenylate cyclase